MAPRKPAAPRKRAPAATAAREESITDLLKKLMETDHAAEPVPGLGALLAGAMAQGHGVQMTLEPRVTPEGPKVVMTVRSLDPSAPKPDPAFSGSIRGGESDAKLTVERHHGVGLAAAAPRAQPSIQQIIGEIEEDIGYAEKLLIGITQLANRTVGVLPDTASGGDAGSEISATNHMGALAQRQAAMRLALHRISDQLTRLEAVA